MTKMTKMTKKRNKRNKIMSTRNEAKRLEKLEGEGIQMHQLRECRTILRILTQATWMILNCKLMNLAVSNSRE